MEPKSKYPTFFDRYGGGPQADIGGAPNIDPQAQPDEPETPYKFDPWTVMAEQEAESKKEQQVQNPWEL